MVAVAEEAAVVAVVAEEAEVVAVAAVAAAALAQPAWALECSGSGLASLGPGWWPCQRSARPPRMAMPPTELYRQGAVPVKVPLSCPLPAIA